MRTSSPTVLPLFRSEMQMRLLGLVLMQPERGWTLKQLTDALCAPQSSVHRELERAEAAGLIRRDATARPHRFWSATEDPLNEPLVALLSLTVGVEQRLRSIFEGRGDILVAAIYGSWVAGPRRPDSDIDVLVIGSADIRDLRRALRPVSHSIGRAVDVTLLSPQEFQEMLAARSSFARSVVDAPTTALVGDLASISRQ